MSQQMKVFVSHAQADDTFCRAVVDGLQGAGADVWYDEQNLGSGQLMEVIQHELGRRPIVVVILSKAALASPSLRREVAWAYELLERDPSRLILPITGSPIERSDFDPARGWLLLRDVTRIEAPGMQPFPTQEAVRRLLHALALTPTGEVSQVLVSPQPTESVEDLLVQGRALVAQQKYAEAVPLFQQATQLTPRSFDAWAYLGFVYSATAQHGPDADAYDHALALDINHAWAWAGKGTALRDRKQYEEALAAYEYATTPAPHIPEAWTSKGDALRDLQRPEAALAAYDQALTLDPNDALTWNNKGSALYALSRYEEALATFEQALRLRETARVWQNTAIVLRQLGRISEAEAALRRAKELGSHG